MKFSKKSRYGVAALIDLAANSKNGHVALGNIAERNGLSPQYLEQVFASLRRAGIVKSVKGSQKDIVEKVNGGLDQILQNLTLADLEEDFQELQSGGQEMYYI